MNFGGPVWHTSVKAYPEELAWRMAEQALLNVGDGSLGEWREPGRNGIVHIRRRLSASERRAAGNLKVRDIRGTGEERRRLSRLLRDAPYLAEIFG